MNKKIIIASILALSATHATADTNNNNPSSTQQVSPGASPTPGTASGQIQNMPQGSAQGTQPMESGANKDASSAQNMGTPSPPSDNSNTPSSSAPTSGDTSTLPANSSTEANSQTDLTGTDANSASTSPSAAPATKLGCETTVPDGQQSIDASLVQQWAQNAALQAFTMNAKDLETQMKSLEGCFTKKGWEGFRSALEKSGNMKVISQEKLSVSASLNGSPTMQSSNDKEWSVLVPIKVIYKNEKTSMNQDLNVQLLVSLQSDGKLGIVQIVAAPQKVEPMEEQSGGQQAENTTQPS